jgi:hypothetical protein
MRPQSIDDPIHNCKRNVRNFANRLPFNSLDHVSRSSPDITTRVTAETCDSKCGAQTSSRKIRRPKARGWEKERYTACKSSGGNDIATPPGTALSCAWDPSNEIVLSNPHHPAGLGRPELLECYTMYKQKNIGSTRT